MDEIQKELMQEGQDGITVLYFVDKIYLAHNFCLSCLYFRIVCINVIQCRVKE